MILSKSTALLIAVFLIKCKMTGRFFQLAESRTKGKIQVPNRRCWPSKCFSVFEFRKKQSHNRKSRKIRQCRLVLSRPRESWALQSSWCQPCSVKTALFFRASCPLKQDSSSWDFKYIFIVRVEEETTMLLQ